jgi:hypothetical protein
MAGEPGLVPSHHLSHIERFSQASLLFWKKKSLCIPRLVCTPSAVAEGEGKEETGQHHMDNLPMRGWHNFCPDRCCESSDPLSARSVSG